MLSGGLFECSLEGRIAAPRVTTQNWVNTQIDTEETPTRYVLAQATRTFLLTTTYRIRLPLHRAAAACGNQK